MKLRPGDLLFQNRSGEPSHEAIATAYPSEERINHVAFALGSGRLIEAVDPEGVQEVQIESFIKKSAVLKSGAPQILCARPKPEFEAYIPRALDRIRSVLGKPYDRSFTRFPQAFYCSSLIQFGFEDLFESHPMSFKKDGDDHPFWIEYFQNLKMEIPEGEMGSHPAALYQSEKLLRFALTL